MYIVILISLTELFALFKNYHLTLLSIVNNIAIIRYDNVEYCNA